MRRSPLPILLVVLMFGASVQGCFGNDDGGGVSADDLHVSPDPLTAGIFQSVYFKADTAIRVLIPYLVLQPETGYVQNGTILDLKDGEDDEIVILVPPRADYFAVLIGELGRDFFPIREGNLSWMTWVEGGMEATRGVEIIDAEREGGLPQLSNNSETGGKVSVKFSEIVRPVASGVAIEDGGGHSTGLVHGLETYDMLSVISDETPDLLDTCDGAKGYLNRWAGTGSPGYECGADFLVQEFTEYGYENVERHRFQYIDANPEA